MSMPAFVALCEFYGADAGAILSNAVGKPAMPVAPVSDLDAVKAAAAAFRQMCDSLGIATPSPPPADVETADVDWSRVHPDHERHIVSNAEFFAAKERVS
jgi:hypothetical protein